MSIKMSDIVALTESGTGFVGGACIDVMPHLTLTEAVNELPVAIVESQIEFEEMSQNLSSTMVESVVTAMQCGTSVDADALMEMSLDNVKTKIKRFFEKIINFLKSIIAKLGVYINKIRMSGKQLYEKYKDSPMLKNKDFKDLSIDGYKFKDPGSAFSGASKFEEKPEDLMKSVLGQKFKSPAEFKNLYNKEIQAKSDEEKASKKAVDDLKSIEKSERVYQMVKALTGVNVGKETWKSDLKKELYGGTEKVTLKYGTDYDLARVSNLLSNPVDLDHVKDEYNRIKTACEKHYKDMEKEADDLSKGLSDASDAKKSGVSICTSYYDAYLSIVADSYDVINAVKAIKYNACKDQAAQAKMIFGKMLTYKSKNESYDADLEVEVEMDDI